MHTHVLKPVKMKFNINLDLAYRNASLRISIYIIAKTNVRQMSSMLIPSLIHVERLRTFQQNNTFCEAINIDFSAVFCWDSIYWTALKIEGGFKAVASACGHR